LLIGWSGEAPSRFIFRVGAVGYRAEPKQRCAGQQNKLTQTRFWSSSDFTSGMSRCFVAQMLAQQDTKPAEGPHVHHLEGVP
jgi:hypothetical protein